MVCRAGVVGEVVFDSHIPVAGGLQLVTCVIDGASHERDLVVRQVFDHSRPEEVEVSGAIALGGTTYAREVLCEDLLLKRVDCVGDALEVVQIGDCAGNGFVLPWYGLVARMVSWCEEDLRAGCENSAGCGGPINSGDVGPRSC